MAAAAGTSLSCGGSDNDSATAKPGAASKDASGLLTEPIDTTAKATKGGVYQGVDVNNIQSLEPYFGGFEALFLPYVYSTLVKFEAIKQPKPILSNIVPDAAMSWETSPDGLTHTYKLRPNMKFDGRSPTNGRAMTSADVKFSFDRFLASSPNANQLMNEKDKDAPITSVSAPDAQTAIIKTAFPYGPLNAFLVNNRFVQIMPTEAYDKFDPRKEMHGSSAWLFKEFGAGRLSFTKNPDWYDAAKVNLDGVTFTNLQEYAAALAQFRAGNIWTYPVKQEDVLGLKRDLPSLLMTRQENFPTSASWLRFGYLPGSPFRDERVRRAASMLIDRDQFIGVFGNVDEFTKAGLKVESRWHTAVPCGEEGLWLDPKNTKEFGENSAFFQFNPGEAKKLIKAAGFQQAIDTKFTTRTDNNPTMSKQAEVLVGMWESNGDFKIKMNIVDNRSDFTPNYTNAMDKHDGIAFSVAAAPPDLDSYLYTYYKSGAPRTGHLDANGQPDTTIDDYLAKQRTEADQTKRAAVLKDFQRYAAGKMYLLYVPGAALGFDLAQPYVGNWGVYRSKPGGATGQETAIYYWYDQSKKA
jgi:peptide/nickel transport system substrate-binding protein